MDKINELRTIADYIGLTNVVEELSLLESTV